MVSAGWPGPLRRPSLNSASELSLQGSSRWWSFLNEEVACQEIPEIPRGVLSRPKRRVKHFTEVTHPLHNSETLLYPAWCSPPIHQFFTRADFWCNKRRSAGRTRVKPRAPGSSRPGRSRCAALFGPTTRAELPPLRAHAGSGNRARPPSLPYGVNTPCRRYTVSSPFPQLSGQPEPMVPFGPASLTVTPFMPMIAPRSFAERSSAAASRPWC